ncbi:SirB1 family protein [Pasteurellaceae bacterium 22721_9_1]
MKEYNKQALYIELEAFYLLTGFDDGKELGKIRRAMGTLVRRARKAIPEDDDVKVKVHKLLQLMYGDWGFGCDPEGYFYSQNLYLNYVLREKKGMPVSLGSILLYLADKLDLPIFPVMFPTQLILRVDVDSETAFIDPWNGQYISQEKLQKLYEGAMGFGVELSTEELDIAPSRDLIERFAQVAKNCLIREELNSQAFKYIERRLTMSKWRGEPDDPYERRDRGLVLAQMGAYHAAIDDLQYFVDKCPEDPTAFLLLSQLPEMKKELEKDLLH